MYMHNGPLLWHEGERLFSFCFVVYSMYAYAVLHGLDVIGTKPDRDLRLVYAL